MQELLEKDGVKVVDDKVVEFEKRFWDPAVELGGVNDNLQTTTNEKNLKPACQCYAKAYNVVSV